MIEKTYIEEIPENLKALKGLIRKRDSWKIRRQAVEELGQYKCMQSVDILKGVMKRDLVHSVQNAAFLQLQSFGENVRLPRKRKGNLFKDIHKKMDKIHKNLEEGYTFEEFKETFASKYPIEYDTYEGDKGKGLDKWLANIIGNLPKK